MTDTVEAVPAPGPAGRVQRTAGQVGGTVVLLDVWLAFGWFGADTWTPEQTSSVTAAAVFLAAVLHNVVGWVTTIRRGQVEVAPVEQADVKPKPKP